MSEDLKPDEEEEQSAPPPTVEREREDPVTQETAEERRIRLEAEVIREDWRDRDGDADA